MTIDAFDLLRFGPPLVVVAMILAGACSDLAAGRRRPAIAALACGAAALVLYGLAAAGASWWLLAGAFLAGNLGAGIAVRRPAALLAGLVWLVFPLWIVSWVVLAPLAIALMMGGAELGRALAGAAAPQAPAWAAQPEHPRIR